MLQNQCTAIYADDLAAGEGFPNHGESVGVGGIVVGGDEDGAVDGP